MDKLNSTPKKHDGMKYKQRKPKANKSESITWSGFYSSKATPLNHQPNTQTKLN